MEEIIVKKDSTLRIQSQLNTPSSWILDGRMFRIKSWEITKEEIDDLMKTLVKGSYSINQIHLREGDLKGISLLYLELPEDVEKIRTTLLKTSSGTELKKISQVKQNLIESRTIKTTAPIWITKDKILEVFSKYNSDPTERSIIIDKKLLENVTYPLVRFYPTEVNRNGEIIQVNVIYIEFSPKYESRYDSFIALSMEHRCKFKNDDEEAILIFNKWTVEKIKDKKRTKVSIN